VIRIPSCDFFAVILLVLAVFVVVVLLLIPSPIRWFSFSIILGFYICRSRRTSSSLRPWRKILGALGVRWGVVAVRRLLWMWISSYVMVLSLESVFGVLMF
jgi:hypothetical protein